MARAILSFPKGSAGGPDGLQPQHLQDMTSTSAGAGGPMLLWALTAFTNLVLTGTIPEQIRQVFFGASLTAPTKKDEGIRPIAVGCTLCRVVAKTASRPVMQRMGSLLAPLQLGYGTPLGAEAAAHSARLYLSNLPSDQVLLKLDFKNAFNSVRRDKMLEAIEEFAPELFPYLFSCYSAPSSLYFNDTVIGSSEEVQQGDPLDPLLFCLVIHPLILQLKSELRLFYLDDDTIGGSEPEVLEDLRFVEQEAASLGLHLNRFKTELICTESAGKQILVAAPDPSEATLLGFPIGQDVSIHAAITDKVSSLKVVGFRLCLLTKHDAILLLRHCVTTPIGYYILLGRLHASSHHGLRILTLSFDPSSAPS